MEHAREFVLVVGLALAAFSGCSGSESDTPTIPSETEAGSDQSSEQASEDVGLDQTAKDGPVADGGGGSAGDAGADAANDVASEAEGCVPVSNYVPTPDEVQFKAIASVPSGEQIIYGIWSGVYGKPDSVHTMAPEGSNAKKLFEIYRVWSLGVSRGVDRIAVASGDPEQEKHYCLALGDAIQNTWMYDIATQKLELIAGGNVNDECHHFGPGDNNLYICRREGFAETAPGEYNTPFYTVGRLALSTKTFELLVTNGKNEMALSGVPSGDEGLLYYTLIKMPSNSRTIMRKPLSDAGAAEVLRDKASNMVLSPDGTRYLFSNSNDKSSLYISNLDGSNEIKIANRNGNGAKFSPDGTRVAYTLWDNAELCSHLEIVKADGSEADSPSRVRDCAITKENVSDIAWVVRP